MKTENEHSVLQLFIQVFIFIFIGIIFLGIDVVLPFSTFFVFSLYGSSAIIFYYLLIKKGIFGLLAGGAILSILIILFFKPSTDIIVITRNLFWYLLIGIMVYSIRKVENSKSNLFVIAAWFVSFILIYLMMAFLNVYIFKFYKINENITFIFYMIQAVKIGGILGFGIGIGKITTDFMFQRNLKTI
ncbi:MAG: hypothetical protein ACM3S2_08930 [Ignavibacteriales bacterium]